MLEGDLGDFTLPDILRLLAFTSKTGRLRLERADAAGRVELIEGRVCDASSAAGRLPLARRLLGLGIIDGEVLQQLLADSGSLPTDRAFARAVVGAHHADPDTVATVLHEQAVDAVFDLLRWNTGSFRFDRGADRDSSPPDLAVPVDELLEEADRRLTAWPDIAAATGAGDAVVTIARPGSESAAVDIDPDGWALLAFVDGRRTVDDLVALTGRGQFDTRRTLGALVDSGIVRVGDPGADSAVQRLLAAHQALAHIEVAHAPDRGDTPGTAGSAALTADSGATAAPTAGFPLAATEPAAPSAPTAPAAQPMTDPGVEPSPTADSPARPLPPTADPPARPLPPTAAPDDEDVTPLRTRVRAGRLTTDPTVDADLVHRLIDGVEGL